MFLFKMKTAGLSKQEVMMNRVKRVFLTTFLIFPMVLSTQAQFQDTEYSQERNIEVGLGFEYSSRTIVWGDDDIASRLDSMFFLVKPGYEIREGISLAAVFGYSLSSYEDMIFRRLPFSVVIGEERIGGYVFGAEVDVDITEVRDFEISGTGRFVYYTGKEKTWGITSLAVEGTATGKPTWMRLIIGPTFTYEGFDYFHPHFFFGYDGLWGKFSMEQKIEALTGDEEKDISAKGKFNFSFGATYESSDRFEIKAELSLIPSKERVDYGMVLGLKLSF